LPNITNLKNTLGELESNALVVLLEAGRLKIINGDYLVLF